MDESINLSESVCLDDSTINVPKPENRDVSHNTLEPSADPFQQIYQENMTSELFLDSKEIEDVDIQPQITTTSDVNRQNVHVGLPLSVEGLDIAGMEMSPTVESVDLGSGSEAAISSVSSIEQGIQNVGISAQETEQTASVSFTGVSDAKSSELAVGSSVNEPVSDLSKFFSSALAADGNNDAVGFFDSLPGDSSLILEDNKQVTKANHHPAEEDKKEGAEENESTPHTEGEKKLPHKLMMQVSVPQDVSFEGPPPDEGSMSRVDSVSKFFAAANCEEGEENKGLFDDFMASEADDTLTVGSPRNPSTIPHYLSSAEKQDENVNVQQPSSPSHMSAAVSPPAIPPQIIIPGSPLPTPVHQTNHRTNPDQNTMQHNVSSPPVEKKSETHCSPFTQISGSAEDPFSISLLTSDSDRRHDAWIPSESNQQAFLLMAKSPPGTYFPSPDQLTLPGIVISEPQGDPVKDLMQRFMGEHEAEKRQTFSASDVAQNEEGMRQLIRAECWRAAYDLSGKLLTEYGQGVNTINQPSHHTQESLQMWFTRIALACKLHMYNHAESEIQAFGSFDRPDLFYEFYSDIYPGRKGSMIPFSFRLLHADLPQYLGKSQESLDRLYYILAVTGKILSNIYSGSAEDGSMIELSEQSRKASRELWESREVRVLFAIVNCLLNVKDYTAALTVLEDLEKKTVSKFLLYSGMARVYLQMGDIVTAEKYFHKAEACGSGDIETKCKLLINKGLVALGFNAFEEAMQYFKEAVAIDPTNGVAINNMAVCALYMGELKQALHTLEDIVQARPSKFLQEGILFNLCTLYELESSCASLKKQSLLHLVSQNKGNGFNVACLKMVT